MQGIKPHRSPDLSLPLRFMAAGLVSFVLAATAIPFVAPAFLRTYDDPHVFALVHLIVLGWITMIMMGALYQLLPVALQGEIRKPRVGKWNFWVYASGVAGFVPSFFVWWSPGIAIFGTLAVGGVIHFAVNIGRSFRTVPVWNAMASYVVCGLGWLTITILFGFVYGLNEAFNWFDVTPSMLAAHAHVGLAGWFALTLMGVSYKLVPLFAQVRTDDERIARGNLVLWNLGLAGLVASLIFTPGTPFVPAFAAVLDLSALIFVFDMLRILQRRRQKSVSLEQWHTLISFGSLLLAAGMGTVLAMGHRPAPTWVVAYGYVALIGCFGFAIAGKVYKIIPFLRWFHRYGRVPPTGRVPLLKDMLDERFGYASLVALFAGYLTTLAGILDDSLLIARIGGGIFAVGSYLLVIAIARVFGEKSSTRREFEEGRLPLPPELEARRKDRFDRGHHEA